MCYWAVRELGLSPAADEKTAGQIEKETLTLRSVLKVNVES